MNPIVEQQNAVNAAFLYALETLSQEIMLLHGQQAAHDTAPRERLDGS